MKIVPDPALAQPRVVIFAEHASPSWGGEAILPLHYFRLLRARGVEAWLVVHERAREGLERALGGDDLGRVHYIADSLTQRTLFRVGRRLPHTLRYFTFELAIRALTQFRARTIVRRLVAEHGADVVHQPIPVSPKEFSLLQKLGAPLVIGPMNGGMEYPPAFRALQSRSVALFVRIARGASEVINFVMPGKVKAQALLVANDRTRRALPSRARGRVITLAENGVDLDLWNLPENRGPADPTDDAAGRPVRFVFAGRLIDWKGVDLLIEALAHVVQRCPATLDVIGDGPTRPVLEQMARSLGLAESVRFRGWLAQPDCAAALRAADVFVLPSLFECGGAVVLEAMACGLPVVATNWGGPMDYVDGSCGILVDPASRGQFVAGLADAMTRLATDPGLRRRMGDAGHRKVVEHFDWQRKVDRILDIYRNVAGEGGVCDRPRAPDGRAPGRDVAPPVVTAGRTSASSNVDVNA